MIELVKFELKKIFSNKLIYIAMAAFFVLTISYTIRDYHDLKNDFGNKQQLMTFAEKYKNGGYTDKQIEKIRVSAAEKNDKGEKLTKEESFLTYYTGTAKRTDGKKKVTIDGGPYTYDEVEKHIEELKTDGKENTFEYNDFLKAKSMMEKLDKPQNMYCGSWDGLFDGVNATIKIALLVLGLATIYSREYKTKVANLNLSTKKGRTSLNTAKIIAALIYTVFIFVFVTIMYRIKEMIPGVANGSMPMNAFENYCIYNISINQCYALTSLMSLLGMVCFTLLIVLLSLLTKNIFVSFGLPLLLYVLGDGGAIAINGKALISGAILKYKSYVNFTKLLKGDLIFQQYLTFDIFGKPVLYPYMIITFAVISIALIVVLCHVFNKKQVIA